MHFFNSLAFFLVKIMQKFIHFFHSLALFLVKGYLEIKFFPLEWKRKATFRFYRKTEGIPLIDKTWLQKFKEYYKFSRYRSLLEQRNKRKNQEIDFPKSFCINNWFILNLWRAVFLSARCIFWRYLCRKIRTQRKIWKIWKNHSYIEVINPILLITSLNVYYDLSENLY